MRGGEGSLMSVEALCVYHHQAAMPDDQLEIQAVIGVGAFGTVYRGVWRVRVPPLHGAMGTACVFLDPCVPLVFCR